MNAVNTLMRETQANELEAAVAAANRWTEIARRLILAACQLNRVSFDTVMPITSLEGDKAFTRLAGDFCKDARRYVDKAESELGCMMLGPLREAFIAEQSKRWSADLSEPEQDALDAFNEALDDQVVTVKAIVAQVEKEDCDVETDKAVTLLSALRQRKERGL